LKRIIREAGVDLLKCTIASQGDDDEDAEEMKWITSYDFVE
jgi:hypothetical protein